MEGLIITCPNCDHTEELSLKKVGNYFTKQDYDNNSFNMYGGYDGAINFECKLCNFKLKM